MFGMSGSELLIIAILALVLLGPERLPGVARTLGRVGRELRTVANGLKAEVQAGLGDDSELGRTAGQTMREVRQAADGLRAMVMSGLDEGGRGAAPAAPAPATAAEAPAPVANSAAAPPTGAPVATNSPAPAVADLKPVSLGELAALARPLSKR